MEKHFDEKTCLLSFIFSPYLLYKRFNPVFHRNLCQKSDPQNLTFHILPFLVIFLMFPLV